MSVNFQPQLRPSVNCLVTVICRGILNDLSWGLRMRIIIMWWRRWWEKVGVEVNMLGRNKNFFMNVINPFNFKKQTDMQVLNLYNFFSINFFSSVLNILFITFSTFKIQKGVGLQLHTPPFLWATSGPVLNFITRFSFSFWVLHAILLRKMAKSTAISFRHMASSNIFRLLWWWIRIYWCS